MVISRTYFCEHCHEAGRPDNGNTFAVQQGTHGNTIVLTAESVNRRNTPHGYTPHFMQVKKATPDEVIVTTVCGIIGCGCTLVPDINELGQEEYRVEVTKRNEIIMTLKDWNALVTRFKGWTGYNI